MHRIPRQEWFETELQDARNWRAPACASMFVTYLTQHEAARSAPEVSSNVDDGAGHAATGAIRTPF